MQLRVHPALQETLIVHGRSAPFVVMAEKTWFRASNDLAIHLQSMFTLTETAAAFRPPATTF